MGTALSSHRPVIQVRAMWPFTAHRRSNINSTIWLGYVPSSKPLSNVIIEAEVGFGAYFSQITLTHPILSGTSSMRTFLSSKIIWHSSVLLVFGGTDF